MADGLSDAVLGARLERAYAAIREHSALCDSLFKDVAARDRVIWNLRDRVPGKKNLLLSKRERSVIRSALWRQIRQFLNDGKAEDKTCEEEVMTRNEKTSARVAKIAARYLPMSLAAFTLAARRDPKGVLKDMKSLAGTASTQTADKERRYNPDVPQPWVDQPDMEAAYKLGFAAGKRQLSGKKSGLEERMALKVDRVPAPKRRPYTVTAAEGYDPIGYDPRDGSGGKPEKQRVPKRKRVTGPARILSKTTSSWPPSAKPPRRSP